MEFNEKAEEMTNVISKMWELFVVGDDKYGGVSHDCHPIDNQLPQIVTASFQLKYF